MTGLTPVEIVHEMDHPFAKRGARGCAQCGRAKTHMDHIGYPQSIRQFGSGANHFTYQTIKHAWQERLVELLKSTGLPLGLGHVFVEGEACFPTRVRRDQGNHRFLIEKCLGDALTAGGWLEDDDWSRYEFGRLAYRYEKGRSYTRLMLFPAAAPIEIAA